jgi:hypothetical protein
MREGNALVTVKVPIERGSIGGGIISVQGGVMPGGETIREERVLWREKTGKETGWILKRGETKTMKVKGKRCIECGFIEFYAME